MLADRLRTERPDLLDDDPGGAGARARSVTPHSSAPRGAARSWPPTVRRSDRRFSASSGPDNQDLVVDCSGPTGDVDFALPSLRTLGAWLVGASDGGVRRQRSTRIAGNHVAGSGIDPIFDAAFAGSSPTSAIAGPNEWDLGSVSWETNPELVISLVDRLRLQDDFRFADRAPRQRSHRRPTTRSTRPVEADRRGRPRSTGHPGSSARLRSPFAAGERAKSRLASRCCMRPGSRSWSSEGVCMRVEIWTSPNWYLWPWTTSWTCRLAATPGLSRMFFLDRHRA